MQIDNHASTIGFVLCGQRTCCNAAGALMPRAATKTRPPTAFRAAAVNATAQEANEGPMRNDNVPVTYSRKKNPAAGEAAAAAVTGTLCPRILHCKLHF